MFLFTFAQLPLHFTPQISNEVFLKMSTKVANCHPENIILSNVP